MYLEGCCYSIIDKFSELLQLKTARFFFTFLKVWKRIYFSLQLLWEKKKKTVSKRKAGDSNELGEYFSYLRITQIHVTLPVIDHNLHFFWILSWVFHQGWSEIVTYRKLFCSFFFTTLSSWKDFLPTKAYIVWSFMTYYYTFFKN